MNETEYETALARILVLFDASPGTAEGDELDDLVTKVYVYEEIHWPIPAPPGGP